MSFPTFPGNVSLSEHIAVLIQNLFDSGKFLAPSRVPPILGSKSTQIFRLRRMSHNNVFTLARLLQEDIRATSHCGVTKVRRDSPNLVMLRPSQRESVREHHSAVFANGGHGLNHNSSAGFSVSRRTLSVGGERGAEI